MKQQTTHMVGLTLAALLAVTSAVLPDQDVLLTLDQTKIPAEVIIRTPEETIQRMTFQHTLIDAIDEAGITLGETDLLSLPDDTILEPGQTYDVTVKPKGYVTLNWSGFELGTSSEMMSMGDLMARSGFNELDADGSGLLVQNKEESASADNGEITYIQIEKKIVRQYEKIPFSTVTIDDPTQYVGKSKVQTEGEPGERALVFEETYENGIFVSSEQVDVEIIKEPVQKVILKGTKEKPIISKVNRRTDNKKVVANFNKIKDLLIKNGNANYKSFKDNGDGTITVDGKTFTYIQKDKRVITMYDGLECCLQKGCHNPPINHKTASGLSACRGVVATYGYRDKNGNFIGTALPLGTILFIEGYGLAVVADVHGVSSNPNLLDACYDAGEIRSGAVTWGKRTKRVYIISLP
ncbi:MAG: G5 domain-containing protein [Clostridia bacterium]|nr:G5 domain-containing protein [Clostridia bacterium]